MTLQFYRAVIQLLCVLVKAGVEHNTCRNEAANLALARGQQFLEDWGE